MSTNSRSSHHISFLNLAEALMLLNIRVARVHIASAVFENKISLTFDTGRLLLCTKVPTDPWVASPYVYNLCTFWRSYFVKDAASFRFCFEILTQMQKYTSSARKIKCLERLRVACSKVLQYGASFHAIQKKDCECQGILRARTSQHFT